MNQLQKIENDGHLAGVQRKVVQYLLSKKVLIGGDFVEKLVDPAELEQIEAHFDTSSASNPYLDRLVGIGNEKTDSSPLSPPPSPLKEWVEGTVNVLFSYEEQEKKREPQDFVSFFNSRYNSLRKLLENRQELQNAVSIGRILGKKDKSQTAIIGIVAAKNLTPNNNYILTLEDPSGQIKVLVNKTKAEVYKLASELVPDEVIGVVGTTQDTVIFANNILHPDIPLAKELKKAPDDCFVLFLSDIHVGSKYFLPEEFNHFLSWIQGDVGSEEQQDIAQKVKYIFFVGDLVDGIGIYPAQERELVIPDIYGQYLEFARLISKIPKHIKLIMCAGNHDALRISEPQPRHDKDFAKPLYELPNVTIVSNPALVNIHAKEGFPGFDVLMYHGYSFDYYIANVDYLRAQGGYDRADLIMKFLLQRRHLAPTHTSTLYIPNPAKDPLIIDKVPDIFASGHIHRAVAANYRNVTLISGSCWQSTTAFQEKMGHKPEPARVPAVNLKTRQVKMLRF